MNARALALLHESLTAALTAPYYHNILFFNYLLWYPVQINDNP